MAVPCLRPGGLISLLVVCGVMLVSHQLGVTMYLKRSLSTKISNQHYKRSNNESSPSLRLVICTQVRNEAPYLVEWLEYHRMLGFDEFLIHNSNSTDDTQCILDAYAKLGVVTRFPQDSSFTAFLRKPRQAPLFRDCARHLQQKDSNKATWMLTSDIDEFVWFNKTNPNQTLKEVVGELIHSNTPQSSVIQSIAIPRLLFGSSGHKSYKPEFVMNRFTHRFDFKSCPQHINNNTTTDHRRLFNRSDPISYCQQQNRSLSYDNVKSMSLVSALARECIRFNPTTGEESADFCIQPHRHVVGPPNVTMFLPNNTTDDTRYLDELDVGPHLAIAHYMTKSRQEFYQRICTSDYAKKYNECPGCNASTFFDLTETYANNKRDERMLPFSKQLEAYMQDKIDSHCETSWERSQDCLGLAASD